MRIISGKYKGRSIRPPAGFKARPTTDYARESLFNILSVRYTFEDLSVLDLFSGTGSISYEFASRGTVHLDLVEINYRNFKFIEKTIGELNMDGIRAIHSNAKTYLRSCRNTYDIIFADPPYNLDWLEEIPDLIIDIDVLTENGVIILEHSGTNSFIHHKHFIEHRKYGNVNFSFFSRNRKTSVP